MDRSPSIISTESNRSASTRDEEEKSQNPPEPQSSTNYRVDITILKEELKFNYLSIIESIGQKHEDRSTKALIIDPSLLSLMRSFISKTENPITGPFDLQGEIDFKQKYLIFFIRPTITNIERVEAIVNKYTPYHRDYHNPYDVNDKYYYIIFTPRRTMAAIEALKDCYIFDMVDDIFDFNPDLIPIDRDLLTLNIPDAARQLYLEVDTYPLTLIAESLHRLQIGFGKIDNIIGKGLSPAFILDQLHTLEERDKEKYEEDEEQLIDCCVILDRNLDYLTPLMSQNVYDGMLDETWGITMNNEMIMEKKYVPKGLLKGQKMELKNFLHKLLPDEFHYEIRDLHHKAVDRIIAERLESFLTLNEEIKAINSKEVLTTQDRAQRMQKNNKMNQLDIVNLHHNIITTLKEEMLVPSHFKRTKLEQSIIDGFAKPQETLDYIENLTAREVEITKPLRLLCLQSHVDSGIKLVALDGIKRDIIQGYGFQHIRSIANLEKAGLLKPSPDKKLWDSLRKNLNLLNTDIGDLTAPTDVTYAYDGYAPVLVRLVEQLFKPGGWTTIKQTLDLWTHFPTIYNDRKCNSLATSERKTVLVYVIGGVTYGEISAFRYLSKLYNKEIIIATTAVTHPDKFIDSFLEK